MANLMIAGVIAIIAGVLLIAAALRLKKKKPETEQKKYF